MAYTEDQLSSIFDRSGGDCHLCGKRLAFKNYGDSRKRAAWEVDHSVAQFRGGTHRLNNLYPACIGCNRSKRHKGTRSVRARNGISRSPLSAAHRKEARAENTTLGVLGGAFAGGLIAGPIGAIAGALVGGYAGTASLPR